VAVAAREEVRHGVRETCGEDHPEQAGQDAQESVGANNGRASTPGDEECRHEHGRERGDPRRDVANQDAVASSQGACGGRESLPQRYTAATNANSAHRCRR
jgi:hypothetical protein